MAGLGLHDMRSKLAHLGWQIEVRNILEIRALIVALARYSRVEVVEAGSRARRWWAIVELV
jgi:hypothetical protein